jgi:hypothetical protein
MVVEATGGLSVDIVAPVGVVVVEKLLSHSFHDREGDHGQIAKAESWLSAAAAFLGRPPNADRRLYLGSENRLERAVVGN